MILLNLATPFWEDPASLTVDGEAEDAVLTIVVSALQAAGYEISVTDEDGDVIPWDDYEGAPDAEAP
jgi:predicted HAD superfamily phosphohydrolase YqeG